MSIVKHALEAARHELTTLHGLTLADGAAPQETWQADTKAVIDQIDQALDSLSQPCDTSNQPS